VLSSWQEFAVALGVMGVVFLLYPDAAPWLGLALVLGALYGLEAQAPAGQGPLADLQRTFGG
jgi:hypothetical protein